MIKSSKTVFVLGYPGDEHAQHVYRELAGRGVEALIIDVGDFPQNLQLSLNPRSGRFQVSDSRSKSVYCSDNVQAIYWRNYNRIPRLPLSDPDQAFIAENDSRSLVESFLGSTQFKWVNGLSGFELHQRKPLALSRVAPLGVDIPATLITNSPEEVHGFCKSDRRYIFKPVQGGAHTQRLKPEHLTDNHLQILRLAPVTIQEEIEGTNIRVFVAGQKVLGCEVRSNEIDFRDDRQPDIIPHRIPDWLAQQSLEIANTLHLSWTGIDFRKTADDRYYFLEANPSPMFIGFERASGLKLSDLLLDHLLDEKRD